MPAQPTKRSLRRYGSCEFRFDLWSEAGSIEEQSASDSEGDHGDRKSQTKIRRIGDRADKAWRGSVSKDMEKEEFSCKCSRTNARRNGIHDRCVQRPCSEKDTELGERERGEAQLAGSEEAKKREGNGGQRTPCTYKIKSAMIRLDPLLRPDSTENRPRDAGDHRNRSDRKVRLLERHAVKALEERRNPRGDAADHKGNHGEGDDRGRVGVVLDEAKNHLLFRLRFDLIAASAFWFFHEEENRKCEDYSWNRRDEKRCTPAVGRCQSTTRSVANRRSNRNGQIEDRKNTVPLFGGIEICKNRRGKDAKARLSYAQRGVPYQQRVIAVNESCEEVHTAPQQRADDDQDLARHTIAKPSRGWRCNDVGDEEPCRQRAHGLIGERKLVLYHLLHAREDVTVDVIDEVQCRQQNEGDRGSRDARIGCCLGHRVRIAAWLIRRARWFLALWIVLSAWMVSGHDR